MFGTQIGPAHRLFRAFGIPVEASPSAAFLLALILLSFGRGGSTAMIGSILVAGVVFVSVVAHELGHGLMVRRLGHRPLRVVLGAIGGVLMWDAARATRMDRIKVALAGPAVSLLLSVLAFVAYLPFHSSGGFGFYAARSEPAVMLALLKMTLSATVVLNLFWGIFNLLPIYPMDGGHALRSALGLRMPHRKALRTSLQISMATAGIVGVAAVLLTGDIFITILLAWMFYMNWTEWSRFAH